MGFVREAMNPVVLSIAPERATVEAARAMAERRVHHLLVARRGDPLGVICTCDVKAAVLGSSVREAMSRGVITIGSGDTIDGAVDLMLRERIGFLPVVEEGAVVGVITRGDLARALGQESERRLMLACKWCQSHRHVSFHPKYDAPLCADCVADEDDLNQGEGD